MTMIYRGTRYRRSDIEPFAAPLHSHPMIYRGVPHRHGITDAPSTPVRPQLMIYRGAAYLQALPV
ncbi:DUF4278 domain-containing protein [Pseudoruegeria sp. HB172150]|uniref:DUF4278 domain-containing protein n=1 Tax=Pseudoruegeria sp. HB172150 TaxID=2721164 RepID=UPI0015581A3C|nr:DUF4278 domain-containing protein [Pseudoruegeria sp. HB172150]